MDDEVSVRCPGCGCPRHLVTPIRIQYECGSSYFGETERFQESERCLLRRILNKIDDLCAAHATGYRAASRPQ